MSAIACSLQGRIVGERLDAQGRVVACIVWCLREDRPRGPAQNAYLYVETGEAGLNRARYVSWINLFDIEHAGRVEAGRWRTVEPPAAFDRTIRFHPFGWGGERLPNVADTAGDAGHDEVRSVRQRGHT